MKRDKGVAFVKGSEASAWEDFEDQTPVRSIWLCRNRMTRPKNTCIGRSLERATPTAHRRDGNSSTGAPQSPLTMQGVCRSPPRRRSTSPTTYPYLFAGLFRQPAVGATSKSLLLVGACLPEAGPVNLKLPRRRSLASMLTDVR